MLQFALDFVLTKCARLVWCITLSQMKCSLLCEVMGLTAMASPCMFQIKMVSFFVQKICVKF